LGATYHSEWLEFIYKVPKLQSGTKGFDVSAVIPAPYVCQPFVLILDIPESNSSKNGVAFPFPTE
jgi:hypothetical protein